MKENNFSFQCCDRCCKNCSLSYYYPENTTTDTDLTNRDSIDIFLDYNATLLYLLCDKYVKTATITEEGTNKRNAVFIQKTDSVDCINDDIPFTFSDKKDKHNSDSFLTRKLSKIFPCFKKKSI